MASGLLGCFGALTTPFYQPWGRFFYMETIFLDVTSGEIQPQGDQGPKLLILWAFQDYRTRNLCN